MGKKILCVSGIRIYVSRVRWLTLGIPKPWEAEAGGSRGQETILVNMVKPLSLIKRQKLAGHGGVCL